MAGLPLIVLEVFLGFGVPLVWAVWELLALRRDRKRQAQALATAPEQRETDKPPPDP